MLKKKGALDKRELSDSRSVKKGGKGPSLSKRDCPHLFEGKPGRRLDRLSEGVHIHYQQGKSKESASPTFLIKEAYFNPGIKRRDLIADPF